MSLREIYLGEEWLHESDGYTRYVTMVMGIICCCGNCYHGDGYKYVAMTMYVTMVMGISMLLW